MKFCFPWGHDWSGERILLDESTERITHYQHNSFPGNGDSVKSEYIKTTRTFKKKCQKCGKDKLFSEYHTEAIVAKGE